MIIAVFVEDCHDLFGYNFVFLRIAGTKVHIAKVT